MAAMVGLSGLGSYAHETAHRVAAHLLFDVVEEEVQIGSFLQGLTSDAAFGSYQFAVRDLSRLGRPLGESLSHGLVLLAGPFVDALISVVLYILSVTYRRLGPRACLGLRSASIAYFAATVYHVWQLLFGQVGDLHRLAGLLDLPPIVVGLPFAFALPAVIASSRLSTPGQRQL